MKIAVCQINSVIGDIEGNFKKIKNFYEKALQFRVDLCVFPELSLLGYNPQDLLEKKEFRRKCFDYNEKLAQISREVPLLFGSIMEENDEIGIHLYNCAFVARDGKIEYAYKKVLLPYYDVFDEVRYFKSGKENSLYEFNYKKIGISICEDIWNDKDYFKMRRYHADPIEEQIKNGAELLINISASPYYYGKRSERMELLRLISKKSGAPLVYCSLVGANVDLIFDGGSMCIDKFGEIVKAGKFYDEDFIIFDTDETSNQEIIIERTFEEEIYEAICFGVKQYAKQTGFSKAVLGLSGGIDSAVVCCIAANVFGKENVMPVLLPSMYSSKGSVDDAIKLCENLGLKFNIIQITDSYYEIIKSLKPIFKNLPEDTTEENIQSRIRGLILMAISNKFNAMLLSCGNKSELAVGYATLYGDMCGALEPIGDVYKTDVYRLANYINRKEEIIPKEILVKAPSAELKPGQKDQDTLPDYEILDKILKLYIEKNLDYKDIVEIIGDSELAKKILSMIDAYEFKRKQAPPVLKVSPKAFGTGRRFSMISQWRKNSFT